MKPSIDSLFERDVFMARHTTFRIGGPARFFKTVNNKDDLENAVQAAVKSGIDWLVIGEGSNLLADDEIIDKAIISFIDPSPPIVSDDRAITVSGGLKLVDFVNFCTSSGLSGLARLAGIPGTVGGAIAGNAGAYGESISQRLKSVTLLDRNGRTYECSANELSFDYRFSRIKHTKEVVLDATYRLGRADSDSIREIVSSTLADRGAKHPDHLLVPTAGSYFKNLPPPNGETKRIAAGRLLDEAGAKNLRVGGAGLWPKHANIVINCGNATANDVRNLTNEMASLVFKKFSVTLEPEVNYLR